MSDNEDKETQLREKMSKIEEALGSILEDDDIELTFCLFRIKGNPGVVRIDKGHFYDITRELSTVVRESHAKMQSETGI